MDLKTRPTAEEVKAMLGLDVEHGDIEALVESYPDMAGHIRAFTS